MLTRNGAITTSGFGRHIGFLGVFRCRALSDDVGWCRRHVHLNDCAGKHVSSRRNFSKCLSRNGDITTSGFRPPYWKWKFMKIAEMSTDCNPRLTAYYRKLTYSLDICYFRHYLQESSNHTKKAKNNWKLINFRPTGGATDENLISPSSTFDRLLNAKNRMKKYASVLELEGGSIWPPPLGQQRYKKAWSSVG